MSIEIKFMLCMLGYNAKLKCYEVGLSIQLMHSSEVDIRIFQPKNSDVHRGEAVVNITFEG